MSQQNLMMLENYWEKDIKIRISSLKNTFVFYCLTDFVSFSLSFFLCAEKEWDDCSECRLCGVQRWKKREKNELFSKSSSINKSCKGTADVWVENFKCIMQSWEWTLWGHHVCMYLCMFMQVSSSLLIIKDDMQVLKKKSNYIPQFFFLTELKVETSV